MDEELFSDEFVDGLKNAAAYENMQDNSISLDEFRHSIQEISTGVTPGTEADYCRWAPLFY